MRIPIPAVLVPLVVLLLCLLVPGVSDSPWTAVRSCGAILAVIGFAFVFAARMQLGKSFSVRPLATELVTHGLYSRIRHPIYVFVDVMFFGLILALHLPWLFLILPLVMAVQAVQAHQEAKVLHEKFGQRYLDYRRRTWF
jgi:protein-S-isoprenylcysteine O-methyltransferase Ste14